MALERVKYALPDLILLDVMMPEMDGFETCRRLQANPETTQIPVIFMTALSDTANKVEGFQLGAVDYITKTLPTGGSISSRQAAFKASCSSGEIRGKKYVIGAKSCRSQQSL
jgi:CheY-like chemotaxis protein